jgi:hypothetical protein
MRCVAPVRDWRACRKLDATDKGISSMLRFVGLFFLLLSGVFAQKHPLQELIDARARRFAELEEPAGARVAELRGRATESSCGRQDLKSWGPS